MTNYDIRIHFPNTSIHLIEKPIGVLDLIQESMTRGKHFTVHDGKRTYRVNSALVTYVEYHEARPF